MKKVLLLVIILLITDVYGLEVKETPIHNVIVSEFNQPAKFNLIVNSASEGNYNIYTLSDLTIRPSQIFLIPGAQQFDIYLYPTQSLNTIGYYTAIYNFNGPDKYEGKLTVKVVNLEDAIYISSDENDFNSGKIEFFIKNNENIELKGMTANFSSVFFENIERKFELPAGGMVNFEVNVNKEDIKTIKAGNYILKGIFQTDKGEKEIEGKIYLGEKEGIKKEEDSTGFLINTKSITNINIGNLQQIVRVEINKNIFTRFFTSFNYEPDIIERKGFIVNYYWVKRLEPAEVYIIKVKTNYIFPFLIIIVAGLIIIIFKHYTESKLFITKNVSPVKTKKGFALKVRLNIKARADIKNVSIIDKIPSLVKVYNKFGSLKPSAYDVKNRRLQWNFESLNRGEERVFDYIIYSKIGVVGKFSLPAACAVFESNGNVYKTYSNEVFFLSEQINKEED